ncbi:MAG: hypothetical protein P0Y49_21400 [Candidatus Pedobacter colombiensis]|uniref:Uncharacterized protein n=1 Tax=Candidatus Pedobacter colombiensis TaxID=3121371 RepID=A0AAJ6B6L4_9SPHI|nr:hypothetical protein [Pedobacter sp.]WEK19335.1 MAG: hypothetical protein P0Y49_21400 [Pedobacter sp.]
MKKYLLFIFITSVYIESFAQNNGQDSILRSIALTKAINFYTSQIDIQRGLNNGLEYDSYLPNIKGSPNFNNESGWNKGDVIYNGIKYKNIPLKYDLVKDLVVVLDTNTNLPFTLINDKVCEFWLLDHHFIFLKGGNDKLNVNGFYDLLSNGNIIFYVKRTKGIRTLSSTFSIEKEFHERLFYLIEKENTRRFITSKSDFLALFKEKKSIIKGYLKANKIDYNVNQELYMKKAIIYYETLNK